MGESMDTNGALGNAISPKELAGILALALRRQDSGMIDLSDNGDLTDVQVFRSLDLVECAREILRTPAERETPFGTCASESRQGG